MPYDPLKLAENVERIVVHEDLRKYYRTARPGRWYGGIATADCCGCCLKCVFCWSGKPRDNPEKIGRFYSAKQIFDRLDSCARRFGYRQLRVSGNEPTIGVEHLLKLLELVEGSNYRFILESNGILIDREYARRLSKFKCIHVRISIKGTNREEFTLLTGSEPFGFDLQLNSLRKLLDAGVPCHPAVMLSFSHKSSLETLKKQLKEIDTGLERDIEEEYVFLYPHVVERLNKAGVKPFKSYSPNEIPEELI
ncbi:radical SAM protein [Candidatus Bathyarchaeota archaeon]|nr:radical SAM protein [Candidatus Bathyarchaeota archaeon]